MFTTYKKYRVCFHLGFWLGYLLFFAFAWTDADGNYWHSLLYELIQLPVRAGMVYFGLYFLMPRFLLTKKYVQFVLYLLLTFLIVGILQGFVDKMIYEYFLFGTFELKPIWDIGYMLRRIVRSNSIFAVAAGLKIVSFWFQKEKEALVLKQEKTNAELNFLKSQIQPHFFFNTLNTLYGLTLTNSQKAPQLVLQLSELMRYMLYETKAPTVSLQKEINHLDHFIELQKLRFGNRFKVQFNKSGDWQNQWIPPMLLLPFVENAFKHSLEEEKKQAFIAISLEVRQSRLFFVVENTMKNPHTGLIVREGIGLQNVKKRLALLFPQSHRLKIMEENGMHLISLQIPLLQNEA